MTKRALLILFAVLLAVLIISCGTTAGTKEEAVQVSEPEVVQVSSTESWANLEGKPWPNSNVFGNWPEVQPEKKDDFELAVNYDLYMKVKQGEPAEYSFYNNSSEYQEKTIRELLDDGSKTSDELELLRAYINLFLDFDKRNAEGNRPLMYYINRIQEAKSVDELSELLRTEYFIFGNPFATMGVSNAADDYNKYGVSIFSSTPYAARLSGDEFTDENIEYVSSMFASYLVYVGYSEEKAKEAVELLISYEDYTVQVWDKMSEEYPDNNLQLTLDQIKELCTPLYDQIIGLGFYSCEDLPVCYNVFGVSDFVALNSIWSDENLDLIKALLSVEMTEFALNYLDMNTYFDANGIDYSEEIDVFEIAYAFLRDKLAGATDQVFLEFAFPADTKAKVTELTERYIKAMRNRIIASDWLTEQTKEKALDKIDNMVYVVVYPDTWLDYSSLLEIVKDHDQNLLDAGICCDDFYRDYSTSYLGKDVERGNWVFSGIKTTEANAFYVSTENSINILAGILYEDLYTDHSIEGMLGTIGATIGHEITHGFDTSGSQYNAYGMKANWWTDEDLENFNQRAQSVADALDRIYVLEDYRQDSYTILDETVADLGGIALSLDIAAEIENFNYDEYFTDSARIWFLVFPDRDAAMERYMNDNHGADYARANFPLQQFDVFYTTYGIKEGDGMYLAPEDRVAVW